ncbi:MAG: hypothetical protein ACREPR_17270, partial [Brasilonema sp.]
IHLTTNRTLQAYTGASDDEAIEALQMDRRWHTRGAKRLCEPLCPSSIIINEYSSAALYSSHQETVLLLRDSRFLSINTLYDVRNIFWY